MDRITERLITLELGQLRLEAHRVRISRYASWNGRRRVAQWLRSLADRYEGRASAATGPGFEGFDGVHLG